MSQDELNKSKVPDPEVVPQAKRRRFSAEYKLRILEEVDACSEPGEIGALLRREGLYSSHLTTWRRQRVQGQLAGLSPKRRGRKSSVNEALTKELDALKRENQRLQSRLQQAETIIEVQKKLSGLLGLALNENQSDEAR
jgi:transposase-like protein